MIKVSRLSKKNKPPSKYAPYLSDPDIVRWIRNLERGSPITAEVSLRRLGRACELLSQSPHGLVELSKKNMKGLQDSLEDLVMRLESEKKAPGYIKGILKAVKNWLRYNDVTLTRRIKIKNSEATPTIENEGATTKEELARVFRTSPLRVKVAESLIAFADLRPEVLGNHDGSDGLILKDLPELKISEGKVTFEKKPTIITVRSPLSKTRRKYFTFLINEGCTHLKEYLEERIRRGEVLKHDSPVIAHERAKTAEKKFMLTRKITHLIRVSMRRAGVWKRPYVLRVYAETHLIIAESEGKISHPYLQFIAGHKGDIEATYSTNKGVLPPNMIEGMRKAIKASEPHLGTVSQIEQTAVVQKAKLETLKTIAKSLLGIDLLEIKIAKEREEKRTLEPIETLKLFEDEIKIRREKREHNIVSQKELVTYLNDGWELVGPTNGKFLVKR